MDTNHVKKPEFVTRTRHARQQWDRTITGIPRQEMTAPGFCGSWSVKDVIAHITWYEREMINVLQTRTFAGSSLWELPVDERNAAIFRENKDRNLVAVLEDANATFDVLMTLLDSLTDAELSDPASFPGMPLDWQPWQVIASNTYEHYEDHTAQAEAWRAR